MMHAVVGSHRFSAMVQFADSWIVTACNRLWSRKHPDPQSSLQYVGCPQISYLVPVPKNVR